MTLRSAVVLVVVVGSALSAQRPVRSVPVLALPAGTRAAAQGEAMSAAAHEPSQLFYNPAGLNAHAAEVEGAVQGWVAESRLFAVVAATRVRRATLAAGVRGIRYGSIDEVIPDVNVGGARGVATGGRVSAADEVLSVGAATETHGVRLGAVVERVQLRVADVSASASTMGFGAQRMIGSWRLGATVRDVGKAIVSAKSVVAMPSRWAAGIASPTMTRGAWRLGATAELGGLDGGTVRGAFGVGARWRRASGVSWELDGGYRASEVDALARPWRVGGAIIWRRARVSYAVQDLRWMGLSHRVGVAWAAASRAD